MHTMYITSLTNKNVLKKFLNCYWYCIIRFLWKWVIGYSVCMLARSKQINESIYKNEKLFPIVN